MSENAKKLAEEKKLRNLRERFKEVKGQASDFDAKQVTENLPNTGSTPKRKPLPTTVEQALADGWTMGKAAGMSDPPVLSFTKDGKTISIRGKMSQALREHMKKVKPLAKKTGGVIKRRGGGIAKRGFGISK